MVRELCQETVPFAHIFAEGNTHAIVEQLVLLTVGDNV